MTVENNRMEDAPNMETDKHSEVLVLRCIDFRTDNDFVAWLEDQGYKEGKYRVYASAGASGNPDGVIEAVRSQQPSSVIGVDHETCGFYKKNGDDSPQAHHHNLEILGKNIHEQNPDINYNYHLLPVNDERHTCDAIAIVLGEPELFKSAREKLNEMGLSNNFDIIARPWELSTSDQTIWNDLEISRALHSPKKVFVFEKDEKNAQAFVEKIKEVAPELEVVPEVLQTVA